MQSKVMRVGLCCAVLVVWGYVQLPTAWARTQIIVHEEIIEVPGPVPVPRFEDIPPPPRAEMEWIPGHWKWEQGWVWMPGHYVRRPHPQARWVPGHWSARSWGWVWISGHWM